MSDPTDIVGRRIGAALLDVLVLSVLFVLVGVLFGRGRATSSSASVDLRGTSALVYFGLALAYYFASEATTGQTLGKRALGIAVRGRGGRPAGVGAIALRTALRVVDILPFLYLVGLLVVLTTGANRHQRLGDLAAGTTVERIR